MGSELKAFVSWEQAHQVESALIITVSFAHDISCDLDQDTRPWLQFSSTLEPTCGILPNHQKRFAGCGFYQLQIKADNKILRNSGKNITLRELSNKLHIVLEI
jgi:hypothetical protein